MLSVPWFLGWALKPYIQLPPGPGSGASTTSSPAADDSGSVPVSAARAQVNKISSIPTVAAKTATPAVSSTASKTTPTVPPSSATSKPYPVVTQPITAKAAGPQTQAQPVQQVTVAKTTVAKTSAAPPPQTTPKPASAPKPADQANQVAGPDSLVSSKTITLKMSAEWAQQQLDKFKCSFDEADGDKSGSLSFDEVFKVLTKNGFKGTNADAKLMFTCLDVNKDNTLSRDEFGSALGKLPRINIKEFVLRKAFKQLDKDGSGTLTKAEIEEATKKGAGLDIAAEKVDQLLQFLQTESKDDVIDYEEFLRVFGVHASATVMHQVFTSLDKDKSGFLGKEEIMKALDSESELKLRAAKISDLLVAWHKDADKKIDYNEFVQVWIKYK